MPGLRVDLARCTTALGPVNAEMSAAVLLLLKAYPDVARTIRYIECTQRWEVGYKPDSGARFLVLAAACVDLRGILLPGTVLHLAGDPPAIGAQFASVFANLTRLELSGSSNSPERLMALFSLMPSLKYLASWSYFGYTTRDSRPVPEDAPVPTFSLETFDYRFGMPVSVAVAVICASSTTLRKLVVDIPLTKDEGLLISAISAYCHHVRDITIFYHGDSYVTAKKIREVLSPLKNLRHLCIGDLPFATVRDVLPGLHRGVVLRELDIASHAEDVEGIVDAIARNQSCRALQHLGVLIVTPGQVLSFRAWKCLSDFCATRRMQLMFHGGIEILE